MYDLRAKAGKNEKRALGHEVGDYTRWAQQHRRRNRLEEASSLDRAIVKAKEQIAMIDQVLKEIKEPDERDESVDDFGFAELFNEREIVGNETIEAT